MPGTTVDHTDQPAPTRLKFNSMVERRHPEKVDVIHSRQQTRDGADSSDTDMGNGDMSELDDFREEIERNRRNTNLKIQHLKLEPLHFRNRITYSVEIPHRVTIRMQRLMGTTKVHLNSTKFVSRFQKRLQEERDLETNAKEYHRIKTEYNRTKKLMIDGDLDDSMVPDQFRYLFSHPACRVNRIIRRLEAYWDTQQVEKPKTKIVETEPFEYNGDEFFKHYHKTGERHWVPAKLVEEPKTVTFDETIESAPADEEVEPKKSNLFELLFKRSLKESDSKSSEPDSKVASGQSSPSSQATKLRQVSSSEAFLATTSLLNEQIQAEAKEKRDRERQRLAEEQEKLEGYRNQRKKIKAWLKETEGTTESAGKFKKELSPPPELTSLSFDKLRKEFGVKEFIDIFQYSQPEKPQILNYIDEADDANALFATCTALNQLYEREDRFVGNFIKELHQLLSEKKSDEK